MYGFLEIEQIFGNCANWDELEAVCKGFTYCFLVDELPTDKMNFISEMATASYRKIENL